jgi:hypothetical protein
MVFVLLDILPAPNPASVHVRSQPVPTLMHAREAKQSHQTHPTRSSHAVCCSAALPPNLQRSIRIISFKRPLVDFAVIGRQNIDERVGRVM